MTWLVSSARVLASAEVATSRSERRRGLLGRTGIDGALLIPRCRWVHTLGMKFDLDVAFLDGDGRVVATRRMRRHRLGLPVPSARSVVEAEAGSFERWGLATGDVVELRTPDDVMPPTRRGHHDDDRDDDRGARGHGPSGGSTGDPLPAPESSTAVPAAGDGNTPDHAPRATRHEQSVRRLDPAPA